MAVEIKKNLAYRRVADEMFVVDSATARLHELNGPAALIWEGLASGKSGAKIVSGIMAEFEVDGATARSDMDGFIAELLKAGLLTGKL